MKHLGFAKLGVILMVLTTAVAVIGVGFGLWAQVLTIGGIVGTGSVELGFDYGFTDDDGLVDREGYDDWDDDGVTVEEFYDFWGDWSSADPAATGRDPKLRYNKDVAGCWAEPGDGPDSALMIEENVYPSYHCTAWFDVYNYGAVPVKVRRVILIPFTGSPVSVLPGPLTTTSPTPLDLDGDGYDDVEVQVSDIELCQQVDPDEVVTFNLDQHILQSTTQSTTLMYEIDVEMAQWNELGDDVGSGEFGPECVQMGGGGGG